MVSYSYNDSVVRHHRALLLEWHRELAGWPEPAKEQERKVLEHVLRGDLLPAVRRILVEPHGSISAAALAGLVVKAYLYNRDAT